MSRQPGPGRKLPRHSRRLHLRARLAERGRAGFGGGARGQVGPRASRPVTRCAGRLQSRDGGGGTPRAGETRRCARSLRSLAR
jgi:hypothetical protein